MPIAPYIAGFPRAIYKAVSTFVSFPMDVGQGKPFRLYLICLIVKPVGELLSMLLASPLFSFGVIEGDNGKRYFDVLCYIL